MAFITPVIEDSPLNFPAFVDAEFGANPSIHSKYAGQDWEEQTYAPRQAKTVYTAKAEMADTISVQFHVSYNNVPLPTLRLFRVFSKGLRHIAEPFYTFPSPTSAFIANNNATLPNGNSEPLATYQWDGSWLQVPGIVPGIYYLVVTLAYNNQGLSTPINAAHSKKSAHIDLKWKHPGTILMSAKNSTNEYDTVFVQTAFTPKARFEGARLDFTPDSEDTSYRNQRGKVSKLFSQPGATQTLVIGGKRGVPQWVKAWANYAMSCTRKWVDNIEITKSENSQWEAIGGGPIYQLGGMSMQIREADRTRRYTTIIPGQVTLFTRPLKYPYQAVKIAMHQTGQPVVTLGSNFLLRSDIDEQNMLQRLQAQITRLGLKGNVAFVGNELRYINHYSEQYNNTDSIVLNQYISVAFNPALAATFALTLDATYAAVDWGDGGYNSYGTGSTTTIIPSHTYTSTGQVEVKVFHSGTSVTKFSTSGNAGVLAIDGMIPSNLTEFNAINGQMTAFNVAILAPAALTLQTLSLRGNKLSTVIDFSSTLNGVFGPAFEVLSTIELRNNRLDVDYVDDAINGTYQMVFNSNVNNGTLTLQGQTPPAPPSDKSPGSPYNLLTNVYNWTVTTD